jgi:hypothetical protein
VIKKLLRRLDPRWNSTWLSNPSSPIDLCFCFKRDRIYHVHLIPSKGSFDQQQTLTIEQYMAAFPLIVTAKTWIEVMNYVDRVRVHVN